MQNVDRDLIALKAEFTAVVDDIKVGLLEAEPLEVGKWQSGDAPQPMPEILNYSFMLNTRGIENPSKLAWAIRPNLPWADNHFVKERISGHPKNPGETWREWPYARSADTKRTEGQEDPQFEHSYAERYWPRYVGMTEGGVISTEAIEEANACPLKGVRFEYGGVSELLQTLVSDPYTRQGYLPVWFPEDTYAASAGHRVPCTLGYHFILRDGLLHCVYPMRSCDFVRHFRDDVYLTLRLQAFLLSHLRSVSGSRSPWRRARMGTFKMDITSLHFFESDQDNLFRTINSGKA